VADTAEVTVTSVPVASIAVSPAAATITENATLQLTAEPRDSVGNPLVGRVVSWSSNNPEVATVSQRGLVLVLTAGIATITASCEGVRATAAVTGVVEHQEPDPDPNPDPPGNPGRVSDLAVVSVGNGVVTLQFTEVHDGFGQPASYDVRFAPAPISWGSAPQVLHGSCATPVAGTLAGAVRRCTADGLSAGVTYEFQLVPYRGELNVDAVFGPLSNVTRATIQAASDRHPNEPAGFTELFTQSFDEAPTSSPKNNSAGWGYSGSPANFARVSDATAPESPPYVLEGTFPTTHNTTAAYAPFDLEKRISQLAEGATEVYVTWRQKLSTNWLCHRKGNKVMLVWVNQGPGDPDGHPGIFTSMNTYPYLPIGSTEQEHLDASMTFSVHTQGINGEGSHGHFKNTGPAGADAIVRGAWQQFEVYIKLNPVPGDPTGGIIRFWVDGVLVGDHTNQLLVGEGQESGFGLLYEFTPIYGGGESDPITQDFTISVDHIYMSGNQ
jgi:hypothetical protein